jgi:hypothetical protein
MAQLVRGIHESALWSIHRPPRGPLNGATSRHSIKHLSARWYAGRIREGYRPHPRHWLVLAELVGIYALEARGR